MKIRTTKIALKLLTIILSVGVLLAYFPANAAEECDESIFINPAPNIININGSMEYFVIHTNMLYYYDSVSDQHDPVPESVTVNGVFITTWKVDDLGYFDAIVSLDELLLSEEADPKLVPGGYNTLSLRAYYRGNYVCGSQNLMIIDKQNWGLGKTVNQ